MSLIEVVVSSAVLLTVLAIVAAFLTSAHTSVAGQQRRSVANDEARAAMEQLDREVRSAGLVLTLDDQSLLVHTLSNAPDAGERCVQWTVQSRELRRRAWPIGHPEQATGWLVIANDIANGDLARPTFVLTDTPHNRVSTGGRAVDTTILVGRDLSDPTSVVATTQSLTGRNIAAGPPPAGAPWPPTTPPPPCEVLP